jgi:hypothetical protein
LHLVILMFLPPPIQWVIMNAIACQSVV